MFKDKEDHSFSRDIIVAIISALITGLITFSITYYFHQKDKEDIDARWVTALSHISTVVKEGMGRETTIQVLEQEKISINSNIEEKDSLIKEQTKQIEELTKQLKDDSEIKSLNEKIKEKQAEIDNLQKGMNSLQDDKDKLQADYDELLEKGYKEYIENKQLTTPISLNNITDMKNQGIHTDNVGDVSVNGTKISYYLDTSSEREAYIEYSLDGKYRQFEGKAYISQWAYKNYEPDNSRITNAAIILEVKYNEDDDYQAIAKVSGLVPDNDPVPIGGILQELRD